MKASELRLRNLVFDDKGNVHYISNISLDIDDEYNEMIGAVPIGQTSHEVLREERELFWKPIPITEEWLLKTGFKPYDKNAFATPYYFIIERDLFGDDRWSFRKRTTEDSSFQIRYFHYVHQLQNLYFALTGEEIKLL